MKKGHHVQENVATPLPEADALRVRAEPTSTFRRIVRKVRRVAHDEGLRGVLAESAVFGYRKARVLLPSSATLKYAGVDVAVWRKPTDRFFQRYDQRYGDQPGYEAALVAGLRHNVRAGDSVVVIGGGWGVTAVIAATLTGPNGKVHCIEGSAEGVAKVRDTARRNTIGAELTVEHAVVGEVHNVYGAMPDCPPLAPGALPECDVLELDCEGAELMILTQMTIRPRVIVVETHGVFGATTALVQQALERLDYQVTHLGVAEPRVTEYCRVNDIHVLEAIRR